MKIQALTPELLPRYHAFLKSSYPARPETEARFKFQILDNPRVTEESGLPVLIAQDEEGEIVGQFILNPGAFHFQGDLTPCHYGSDLFMREDKRASGIGAFLTMRGVRDYSPYFAIGLTTRGDQITRPLNTNTLGEMYSFLWIGRPVSTLVHHLRNRRGDVRPRPRFFEKLPPRIEVKGGEFNHLSSADQVEVRPLGENLIEFARDPEFIKWRFFSSFRSYPVYLKRDGDAVSYFALRRLRNRGLDLILVVDYRVSPMRQEAALDLIAAVKKIARLNRADGVWMTSTLKVFDQALRQSRFRVVGNPGMIVSTVKTKGFEEAVSRREFVFATLADSDGELNYY